MKSLQFQKAILDALTYALKSGQLPLASIQKIAGEAIDISSRFSDKIPDKEVEVFLKEYPECGSFLRQGMEKEANTEEVEAIEGLRKIIQQHS